LIAVKHARESKGKRDRNGSKLISYTILGKTSRNISDYGLHIASPNYFQQQLQERLDNPEIYQDMFYRRPTSYHFLNTITDNYINQSL